MLIDIVFLLVIFFAAFKGISNGLIVALFSFVGALIGIAVAVKFSVYVAEYLKNSVDISQRWLPLLAFVLVFVGTMLLVRLGARALQSVIEVAMLGWLNRIGGIFFYALLYIFIYSIVLFYLAKTGFIKQDVIDDSSVYQSIAPLGPKVIDWLSKVIPYFQDMFKDLEKYFDGVFQPAPAPAPPPPPAPLPADSLPAETI